MKTILYSVSTGYFARNLLRTGVIERLLEHSDIRIVIVTPGYDDENFVKEFSFSGRLFIEKMYEVDRSYDFMDKLIWKSWLLGHKYRYFQILYKLFLKIQLRKRYYNKFHRYYGKIFDKYSPDLIVGASPGVNSRRDLPVFAEAQERGIKTLALIHSWDNIAKRRGPLWVRPNVLGVWNRFQKQETIKAHFYKEEDVRLVGAPHFDIYWREDIFMGRDLFFKKMGLDPNKKLITTIATVQNLVDNSYIVDILLGALKKNMYILPVQLLFRVSHTNEISEKNDKMYGRFYSNPNVIIDHPGEYSTKLGWNPSQQQLRYFANLVKYSDVQVSIVSTATIEAAILDRPVVNVGFSTIQPDLFQKRIIESVFKNHFKPIIDYKSTYIAKDSDDLIAGINKYLLNPDLHREERRKLKEALLYRADGKAVERISQTILDLLR